MKPQLKLLCAFGMMGLIVTGAWLALRQNQKAAEPADESSNLPEDVPTSFHNLVVGSDEDASLAIKYLDENWQRGFVSMLAESYRRRLSSPKQAMILDLLKKRTGQDFGMASQKDNFKWLTWGWNQPYRPAKEYLQFKAWLYSEFDPRFANYFEEPLKASIRIDEVMWGGVRQDGIPPLDNPNTIAMSEADYLDDNDVVFGVEINGTARAYPQRILGHHEMVRDQVGGSSINGVYCTLCNSMIVYDTNIDGKDYLLGTSGFLYRSNKLMFDRKTQSLWSTIEGKPVVGPLTDTGLELTRLPVVTTTWGQWRAMHPTTDVMSLPKHQRNYDEGVAYASYYATDELMFPVPKLDDRLKNKAPVLGLRFGGTDRLAISSDFLANNPIVYEEVGGQRLVVLTDKSGASRVYEAGSAELVTLDETVAADKQGRQWEISEIALTQGNTRLRRLPAHRAFWFAWQSMFPDTRLIRSDE